ncbi:hypothetical protein BN14_03904 [Rhizoctonia solani AG-1 IB]|uniref:Uncharacterized protein n=1 Tax=Thanatephorus cucumeris (strain AG1-IB / isolate 7/3/14) TaxID=1108050 RepID=M5BQ13_THACB|nr:hypothetical protein BN14_03904 [Rhizoctonia solani AG-1 IB]
MNTTGYYHLCEMPERLVLLSRTPTARLGTSLCRMYLAGHPGTYPLSAAYGFPDLTYGYNYHGPGRIDASNNTTNWSIPLTEYLGDNTAFSSREITRNVGGEPLRYPLRVFFRDNFLRDGSPLNHSVSEITHGNARHDWAGNIVVLKWTGARRQGYQNMTLGDLPIIAAWLLAYD